MKELLKAGQHPLSPDRSSGLSPLAATQLRPEAAAVVTSGKSTRVLSVVTGNVPVFVFYLVVAVDADKTGFVVKTDRLLQEEETLTQLIYQRARKRHRLIQARSTTQTNTHIYAPCRAQPGSTNLCFLSPPRSICHNTPVLMLPTHKTAYQPPQPRSPASPWQPFHVS